MWRGRGEWWEMAGCSGSTKLEPLQRPTFSARIKCRHQKPSTSNTGWGERGVRMKQEEESHFGSGKGKFGRKKPFLLFLVLGWKSYNRHRECQAVNVLFFTTSKLFLSWRMKKKTVSLLPPHFVRRHRPIGFLLPLLLSFRSWVRLEKEKEEKERTSFFLFFPLFSCFSALSIILSNFSPSLLLNKKSGWLIKKGGDKGENWIKKIEYNKRGGDEWQKVLVYRKPRSQRPPPPPLNV